MTIEYENIDLEIMQIEVKSFGPKLIRFYKNYSSFIFIILIPLIASILPIAVYSKQALCGFVLIVMAGYWITECLPYAIVSLLPVVFFPLFGIMQSKEVTRIYFSDILMLFFGGLIMAICVETSGLHKKVAFRVIMLFGSNPLWLLLGIMGVTGFLSLWISNVASASMMLPIIIAMVKEIALLDKTFSDESRIIDISSQELNKMTKTDENIQIESESAYEEKTEFPNTKAAHNLMKCFLMSLSYSASIGGSGSLVGTAPNLILKGYFDENYPKAGLNFFTFMLYSVPCAFLMIISSWIMLALWWFPKGYVLNSLKSLTQKNKNQNNRLTDFIKREYEKLGPLNWEQGSVGGLFLCLVFLWITRDLFFVPGWGELFEKGYPTDTTSAILIVIFLVAWPRYNIFKGKPYKHLITWNEINDKFAWNIIILSGGGLALAAGFEKSDLSGTIGQALKKVMPSIEPLALLILLAFSFTCTEFSSNTSMASILIPMVNPLALEYGINPSYLLMPLTISTSYSFMLPVATPTNAIVFGAGYLTVKDMLISGAFLKFSGIIVLFLSTLWRPLIFNDEYLDNFSLNTTLASI